MLTEAERKQRRTTTADGLGTYGGYGGQEAARDGDTEAVAESVEKMAQILCSNHRIAADLRGAKGGPRKGV